MCIYTYIIYIYTYICEYTVYGNTWEHKTNNEDGGYNITKGIQRYPKVSKGIQRYPM